MTPDLPEFVDIPGGTFRMGKDESRMDERPSHMVTIASFGAAVSPVTNAQYALFVAETGAAPAPFLGEPRFAGAALPVVGVSWFEAVAFCEWLGTAAGDGARYRLPTEAEREFAALGALPGGDWPWEGENATFVAAISKLQGPHEPRPDCANGYGLRCMAENVHEWCSDWYSAGYYAVSPAGSPRGPETGTRRASRGGSWRHREKTTRVNARSSLDPAFRYSDFGFRVYRDT